MYKVRALIQVISLYEDLVFGILVLLRILFGHQQEVQIILAQQIFIYQHDDHDENG